MTWCEVESASVGKVLSTAFRCSSSVVMVEVAGRQDRRGSKLPCGAIYERLMADDIYLWSVGQHSMVFVSGAL